MAGVFYGVGVGPGDPELLTVKAIRAIQQADVVIAPKTEKKDESTALTIAQPFLKAGVPIVRLVFPMVFDGETLSEAWENNKNTILELLAAGKKVVFLTLGDPMFYSTYIYIFHLLENCGYPVETIPGVPAFCAMASKLGYPLAEGNDTLSVVPATLTPEQLDRVLARSDNVVLMKVYKNYQKLIETLKRHGLAENAVMVSRCGLEDEQVVRDVTEIGDQTINYLSTILTRRNKA
ncbi:precorrin-2/cobalt-factor-2 C20-methyltransferase [Hydrogenispora ethanolica]|uniref:Precorrin-2/cobalt-factor-2 C20-methyltransferase n=1 Tax=Hydrogenispora ethanolica TaxID=1082276 RepID=A0A4R1RA13_HYDET|nr:precorrin-2 C(20)-methyltransferase [Hydrogenispora ethanolica]TCL62573.1 precorrin-2/cobalt-factor-2 C20-methyltransferase [Hydrogenispora ethanolica]